MSTIKANTLLHSDGSTTNPPAIPALDKRMAKAWARVNQGSTHDLIANYNMSSVTDISAGVTQFNYATAMSSNTYAAFASDNNYGESFVDTWLTTSVKVRNINGSGAYADANIAVCVFSN